MDTTNINKRIDKDLRPAYYDDFQCIGADCQISCCKGWNITFDKKDYLSLKKLKHSPELSNRIDHAMKRLRGDEANIHYAKFDMPDGICPLLAESGLCFLQLEKGHKALPEVCRIFPRKKEYYYSGYLQRSLSPACEAVLGLLWDLHDGIEFRTSSLPTDEIKKLSNKDPSPMLFYAYDIQSLCIDILQDRRLPLSQRIILMGVKLQELAKPYTDIPEWIVKTKTLLSDPQAILTYKALTTDDRSKVMYISNNLNTLLLLMNIHTFYKDNYEYIVRALVPQDGSSSIDMSAYNEAENDFFEILGDREDFFENLFVTLMFNKNIPELHSAEELWKSYVHFCNLCSIFRFISMLSVKAAKEHFLSSKDKDDTEDLINNSRNALFHTLVIVSRALLHSERNSEILTDKFFMNDSSTLAHMAILVSW